MLKMFLTIVAALASAMAIATAAPLPLKPPEAVNQELPDVTFLCKDGTPIGMIVRAKSAGEWQVRFTRGPCIRETPEKGTV